MKFLKNAAVRATALLVFAAMISAVILWQAGAYDISFIKRPAPHITDTAGTTGSGDDTDPSDNTTTTPGTTEPPGDRAADRHSRQRRGRGKAP